MKISVTARATGIGLAVTGLLATMATVASPAQAIPGLVRTTASSVSDSATTKTISAACPAGTRILGGGGEIVGGAGQVLLTAFEPVSSTNRYSVRGHEDDDGYTGNWQVIAYAVCGNSPAGLEYITDSGQPQSASFGHYTTARCTPGKHFLGFGGRTNDGAGHVSLEGMNPFEPAEVLVPAAEDPNGFSGLWSLTAHLVCANPISGWERVFARTPSDSSASPKTITVSCPAGKRVHSASFSGGGAVAFGEFLVRSVVPDAALTSVTVSAEEVDGGTPDVWDITAWAVCVP